MIVPSDAALTDFVTASAVLLDITLDDDAREAVVDAMRGVAVQAALVLDYMSDAA